MPFNLLLADSSHIKTGLTKGIIHLVAHLKTVETNAWSNLCHNINRAGALNQIVRQSRLPRPKVIALLARLIRFSIVKWEYANQQFLFSLS